MKQISIILVVLFSLNIVLGQELQQSKPPKNTGTKKSVQPSSPSAQNTKTIKNKINKIDHNLTHKFLTRLENPSYSDQLIKTYPYKEKRVYRINTTLLIDTEIILPEGESIKYARVSVKNIFNIKNIQKNNVPTNRIIISTKGSGVSSNLIIITDSGRSYNFLLLSRKLSENNLPDLAIYIEDSLNSSYINKSEEENNNSSENFYGKVYKIEDLKEGLKPNSIEQRKDYLSIIDKLTPKQLKKINLINYNYRIYINDKMDNPISVFDDGVFTYFKFKEEQNLRGIKIPGILGIENRVEKPVNVQRLYNYIIVKDIFKYYILKRGKEYICIEKLNSIKTKNKK